MGVSIVARRGKLVQRESVCRPLFDDVAGDIALAEQSLCYGIAGIGRLLEVKNLEILVL